MKKETIEYFEKMRDAVAKTDEKGIDPPYGWGAMNAFRCYEDSDNNHSTADGEAVLECEAVPELALAEEFQSRSGRNHPHR